MEYDNEDTNLYLYDLHGRYVFLNHPVQDVIPAVATVVPHIGEHFIQLLHDLENINVKILHILF